MTKYITQLLPHFVIIYYYYNKNKKYFDMTNENQYKCTK